MKKSQAIEEACGWMPPHRPSLYADLIVKWSAHFGVDPMLLGALMVAPKLVGQG